MLTDLYHASIMSTSDWPAEFLDCLPRARIMPVAQSLCEAHRAPVQRGALGFWVLPGPQTLIPRPPSPSQVGQALALELQEVRDMPCPTPYTSYPTTFTSHPTPFTLHPTPYTLHPTPYTLHPTPYTIHHTPYTVRPTPCTIHHTPYTLHRAPYTLHPTPYTLHPTAFNRWGRRWRWSCRKCAICSALPPGSLPNHSPQ